MNTQGPLQPGVLIVDKPADWSSHDVVARIRKLGGTRRVGHAGTLDPMATGVLVVGLNRATRMLGYLQRLDKEYEATIRLGQATHTDDGTGEITAICDISSVDDHAIDEAIAAWTGPIRQVPSRVSAIKVAGRRSYDRVRSGEAVDLEARPVTVWNFDRRATVPTSEHIDVDVRVTCSSGTYVRALARDIGQGLNVGGHLTALRRTRVGPFDLVQARGMAGLECVSTLPLVGLDHVVRQVFPVHILDSENARRVCHGRTVTAAHLPDSQPVGLFDPNGEFLALYEFCGAVGRPLAVFV